MVAASLRALLERAIDYAGLFPPAELALEPALRNYADYVRVGDAWMLGAFILPVAQFAAAQAVLPPFEADYPLRVSALGPKTNDSGSFLSALESTRAAIDSFSDTLSIQQLEMFLPIQADGELVKKIHSVLGAVKLKVFWEAGADAAEQTIRFLSEHNHADLEMGFKLRTGGVTADAFPSPAQIAQALLAAAQHRVPIKFTAGLHHPLRQFHASVGTKMHGFLNVLGAGVLAAEHQWDERQTVMMLEDEDASSFTFDDSAFTWRDWSLATDRIPVHRKLVTSLGSCSFDEPREDLRALRFL
ncbi:MAG: hypothetical protein ABJB09_01550 [Verrucomicrobiota bacterium]